MFSLFSDYPWAGSLRPVSKEGIRSGGRQVNEPGHMPWAGSLRHVDQNKNKRRHARQDDGKGITYRT